MASSGRGRGTAAAVKHGTNGSTAANHDVPLPIALLSDSYKATHFLQYPASDKMAAYGEFRWGYDKDTKDRRCIHFGIRYLVERYLLRRWTDEDLRLASQFYATHCAGATQMPWPEELFRAIVHENDGWFPIRVEALPEGSCTHARVPVYQIVAEGRFACLCLFLETLLTHIWYPSTVATLSRRARDVLESAFHKGAEGGKDSFLLPSRLHDFGMRGCTTLDQATIGGCAHLLNFEGTDTMSAAFHAQYNLNNGEPVGFSIPATEHSVMTSWPTERDAILRMIDHFGEGLFACVMDSYDYTAALEKVLPSIRTEKVGKGGFMVLRPDSGDPVTAVLQALKAADNVFGSQMNSKGYKVINGCGVIQGDGINLKTLNDISDAVLAAGYSPENVAYGMGAGLLQKLNRDTMGFATKLNHISYLSGEKVDVMKSPKTDASKQSFPGVLAVKRVDGIPCVFPAEAVSPSENMLKTVYDCGPVDVEWETFAQLRERVKTEWTSLPPVHDVISKELRVKIDEGRARTLEKAARAQEV